MQIDLSWVKTDQTGLVQRAQKGAFALYVDEDPESRSRFRVSVRWAGKQPTVELASMSVIGVEQDAKDAAASLLLRIVEPILTDQHRWYTDVLGGQSDAERREGEMEAHFALERLGRTLQERFDGLLARVASRLSGVTLW